MAFQRMKSLVDKFTRKRVLVVGDLMLDRYVYGSVGRISPEAPVPVVEVSGETCVLGGATNVARNIRALGGKAVVAGVIGNDSAGDDLIVLLEEECIASDGIIREETVLTTIKTRVIADRQQIVRVDRERSDQISAKMLTKLCKRIEALIGEVDGVIVEDYGKGVIQQKVVDTVLKFAKKAGIPVSFDPKDDHHLKMTGITLATPNFKEACSCAGIAEWELESGNVSKDPKLKKVGDTLLKKWRVQVLLITLGKHGMYVLSKGKRPSVIPTQAREVFDVSGAGDTVISTATLAITAGASNVASATLSNAAAGVVVGKLGTAPCSAEELKNAIA